MVYTPSESIGTDFQQVVHELARQYYSNSQNSVHYYNEPYYRDYSLDNEMISKVVDKLISDKFRGTLGRIKQRSMERRRSKMYCFGNTYEELPGTKDRSEDSGLNMPSFEDFSDNSCASREAGILYEKIAEKASRLSLGNMNPRRDNNLFGFGVSNFTGNIFFYN